MFFKYSKNFVLLIILGAIVILFSVVMPDKFLTFTNFRSIFTQMPELGLLTLGIAFSLMSGGIDLSMISISVLSGTITAKILVSLASAETAISGGLLAGGIALAIAVAIIVALACGVLNGWLISYIGIPAILATIGTWGLYAGISMILTKGANITGFPEPFLFIGNGLLFGFLPTNMLIFIVVTIVAGVLLTRLPYGLSLRLIGSNYAAARFSGININTVLIKTYVLTSFLAGITGIILISRINTIRANFGYEYLFPAVLCAVLSGVNPLGGFGSVWGVVIAVTILQVTKSSFHILAINPWLINVLWGSLLIIVAIINYYITQRQKVITI